MKNGFELTIVLPATPDEIYKDWLSSKGHTSLTGSPAKVDGKVGGKFTAWDGYISGRTLELEPGRRIVQAWRTSEFPEEAPDSRLEILLEAVEGGTKLTLIHSDIPSDQVDSYRTGWPESYFEPMQEHYKK
jgi:activator of HSP90 ATPase